MVEFADWYLVETLSNGQEIGLQRSSSFMGGRTEVVLTGCKASADAIAMCEMLGKFPEYTSIDVDRSDLPNWLIENFLNKKNVKVFYDGDYSFDPGEHLMVFDCNDVTNGCDFLLVRLYTIEFGKRN